MRLQLTWMVALFFATLQFSFAQKKSISGTVTDESGLPLPGVAVLVKETTKGTQTDFDGNYQILVEEGKTLVFSYVGMTSAERKVGNSSVINVVLKVDAQELDAVVVTAMGVSREKKALGYATTFLRGEEIQEAQTVNPMNALQGKVAGVDISTAPGPGATQNVLIRGVSSFGNNQPLYIVDGIPITNSQDRSGDNLNSQVDFGSGINALNPDDIEEMTILKGAAATALYGSRAANGVVMITTKSGKNTDGKIRVTYDGSVTISRVGRLSKVQERFGQGWSGRHALDENGNWGPAYDGKQRVWGNIVSVEDKGSISFAQQVKPYSFVNNRVRDFYEYGNNFKNSVSMSGGNEKTNFLLSLSQNSVDGVFPTNKDSYNRYTIATKGMHKANKLTASANVNFSIENKSAVPSGQGKSVFRSLYEIPNDIPILDLKDYTNKFNDLDNYFTPYSINPWFVLNKDGAEYDKKKVFGKFQLDYEIFKALELTYRFGGDFETSISNTHQAVVSFTPGSWNAKRGSSAVNPGSYEQIRKERTQMNHDLILSHKETLSDDIVMNGILGFNANQRTYSWLEGKVNSIDIPEFYNLGNSLAPSVSRQYTMERRLIGLYANIDFSYKNYIYLTLTARNDWSSTLPLSANSYFYPGITTSFLLTDFFKAKNINSGILSFAKVRAAYGMTGNDASPYYVYDRYVSGVSQNPGYPKIDDLTFPLGGINSYMVSNQLGNANLKSELTKEFEIGIETRFFKNRFGFDFSYYNRLTEGLIESLPKDPSTGYTYQLANLGDVRNKGIELVVDGTPVKLGGFSWNIAWNFSMNKNKVERLDVDEVFLGGFSGAGIYAVEGEAMGQFKIETVQKVKMNGVEKIVVDGSGNPIPSPTAQFVGKDINEKYRMGLTNTFRYKGISLSATLDFRYGGYMYTYTKNYLNWTGANPESIMNNRRIFLIPNSVISDGKGGYEENTIPVDPTALHTFYSKGGIKGEEENIISKSYLKLRNIGLSYEVPKSLCDRLHINNIRMSLTASNILLWTPNENVYIDPETTTFGNDVSAKFGEYGAGPNNESYTFGLSFGF